MCETALKKGASCLATKLWLKILTLLWKKTLTFGKQRPTLSERPLEPIIRDLRPLFSLFHSFRQGAVLKSPRRRSGWTDCWCKLRPRAVPVPAKKRERESPIQHLLQKQSKLVKEVTTCFRVFQDLPTYIHWSRRLGYIQLVFLNQYENWSWRLHRVFQDFPTSKLAKEVTTCFFKTC